MTTDTAFWDRAAPRYARSPVRNTAAYAATLDRVRSYLTETDRVLESGCGTGSTALKLAPHVADYTATDISPGMIEIAQTKAAEAGVPNLTFTAAPADSDPFEPESFDAVLAFNLLHLLRDLPAGIARARALLKPGGLYITKSGCLGNMNPLLRLALPVLRAIGKAPYVNVFTRDQLEAEIRAAGFEIVEARAFEGAPATWFVVARKT
ncbi:class I SAM-dependent methyltransferase [Psychromarinibacter sp. C21-152]|uniref:Class I SAM-dependent methyltransferase n=1 Tax=Psychromarinibacter sediminicola TaxID=3033385 RepID=A0AAE3NPA5_9RHOB|nr:class I SAM-dependent methyltransferase [Psychromarinibacter sediminicola]MDF0599159.1 class I SAM-dependent methyltransferase [Psychromarinibacter sediminicola]